jgi:hypothetical protein
MSIKCQLLGWWEHETKGYHLEDIEKQSLITSHDVRFVEDDSPTELAIIEGEYPHTEDDLMDLLPNHKPQPSSCPNTPAPLSPTTSTSDFNPEGHFEPDPTPNVISPPHKSLKYDTLSPHELSSRVCNAPIQYGVEATPDDVDAAINAKAIHAQAFIAYTGDPSSYQHMLSTPHSKEWEAALKSEYNQPVNTGTFKWVRCNVPYMADLGNRVHRLTSPPVLFRALYRTSDIVPRLLLHLWHRSAPSTAPPTLSRALYRTSGTVPR